MHDSSAAFPIRHQLFIDGKFIDAASGETLTSVNPHGASDLAVANPYWNPRTIEREGIRSLLQHAWEGSRPT